MNILVIITTLVEWCLFIIFIVTCYTYITIKCSMNEREEKINELIQDKYNRNRYQFESNSNGNTDQNTNNYDEYVVIDMT